MPSDATDAWRRISLNDILAIIPPAHERNDPRLLTQMSDVELELVIQFVDLRELELRQAALHGAQNGEEREKVYRLQAYLRAALAAANTSRPGSRADATGPLS